LVSRISGRARYRISSRIKLFKDNVFCILPNIQSVKTNIRPDIRYPAFGLAGYPAKTVSGASLVKREKSFREE
jgi:hypothetical protein